VTGPSVMGDHQVLRSGPPKEVQLNYIKGTVPLMLWYMRKVMVGQGVPFSLALSDYVDIYRKTSLFNLHDPSKTESLRPKWLDMVACLEEIFTRNLSEQKHPYELEQQSLELLWPFLAERIDMGLPLVEFMEETSFGCFFYIFEDSAIDLHFVNKVLPESPFRNSADRVGELHRLVEHCQRVRPDLSRIKFGSWLNDYTPFSNLFPSTWQDTGEGKKFNSIGWWGQFVRHDGGFHSSNGEKFRATGEFPYQFSFHQWELGELKEHLRAMLA